MRTPPSSSQTSVANYFGHAEPQQAPQPVRPGKDTPELPNISYTSGGAASFQMMQMPHDVQHLPVRPTGVTHNSQLPPALAAVLGQQAA